MEKEIDMSIVNLEAIKSTVIDIRESCMDDSVGVEWTNISRYVGALIIRNRIEQELRPLPLTQLELELAKLEGK